MATIVLRSVKGSPLSISEGDSNFSNLNNEKIERNGSIDFTAPQAFVLGSVGAPSIKPVGSSTTGLYFPSTSSVAISIGGTQKLLVDASGITADGANLTNLNASNLASGTVPSARLSGAYTGINQIASALNQTDLSVSGASGTFRGFIVRTNGVLRWYLNANDDAESGGNAGSNLQLSRYDDAGNGISTVVTFNRATGAASFGHAVSAAAFSGDGANLTNLNASNLASGTVPTARLGSGTANSQVFLRGDGTWSNALAAPASGATLILNGVSPDSIPLRATNGTVTSELQLASSGPWFGPTSNHALHFMTNGTLRGRFAAGGDFITERRAKTEPTSVTFSASLTVDAQLSNVFYIGALTGNVTTFTISNPADGQTIQIRFVQDATGGRTVALPSGAVVSGSINSAANSVTWLVMTYVSSASRWEGTWTRVS